MTDVFSKQHEILLLSFMHSLYISLYRSLDSDPDSNREHPRKCLQCMMTGLSEQECTYQLKKMFADQGFRMGLSADWRNIQVSESLNPQSPQVTICCYVCAAILVHLRLGRPGPPARGFKVVLLGCHGNTYLILLNVLHYYAYTGFQWSVVLCTMSRVCFLHLQLRSLHQLAALFHPGFEPTDRKSARKLHSLKTMVLKADIIPALLEIMTINTPDNGKSLLPLNTLRTLVDFAFG